MPTLDTDDVVRRVEYALKRSTAILMDIRTQPGDLYTQVQQRLSNIGDLLAAEVRAWGFDAAAGVRAGAGEPAPAVSPSAAARQHPSGAEVVRQAWNTFDAVVWALRAEGVPLEVIQERLRRTSSEFDPSPRPAFQLIEGGGDD